MMVDEGIFGPFSNEEEEVFAVEDLIFDVQIALQRAMREHGVSQSELANRLGVTPARVSQMFADSGANLTLETVAKIAIALETTVSIAVGECASAGREHAPSDFIDRIAVSARSSIWVDKSANKNIVPALLAG